MRRTRAPAFARRRPYGLSLVEVLIALGLSAMLLVATAVGVDASARAYQINQEQSLLIQRARIAMERMTTVIRTTHDHAPDSVAAAANFAKGQTVTDTGIDLFDTNNVETMFRYDAPGKRILAIIANNTYVLVDGVESFQITLEPMQSANSLRTGGGFDLLRRANITLAVRNDALAPGQSGQTIALSASVMPRQNTW